MSIEPASGPVGPAPDGQRDAAVPLDRLGHYLAASHSPNTLRGYDADWAHFAAWCTRSGYAPLPADAETVARYLLRPEEVEATFVVGQGFCSARRRRCGSE